MSDESRLLNVIGLLYDSVLDESQWPEALRSLYTLLDGHGVFYLVSDPQDAAVTHSESFGIDPAIQSLFQRHYATKEIRIPPALCYPVGTVMPDSALIDLRTLRRSELYNELLVPHDIPYIMAVWLEKSERRFASLSVQGSLRHGPFQASQAELFSRITPHLARCVRLREQLLGARRVKHIYMELLDNYPFGVVLLDECGYVLEMTRAAQTIVRGADGLGYSKRRIRALSAQDDLRLQPAIRNAVRFGRKQASVGATIAVRRASGQTPLAITVTPLSRTDRMITTPQPAALMVIVDPELAVRPRVEAIQRALQLTRAEAALADQLFSGASLREAAERLGRSINTCKSQLKSIYSKTGSRNHVHLVKMMMPTALSPATLPATRDAAPIGR